jgi:hypothetical protein
MMRFTLVERDRGVSFVAPPTALAVLVAGCARDPVSIAALLDTIGGEDADLSDYIRSGLAVFDEHNTQGHYEHIHAALARRTREPQPVFRIVDEVTRAASLQPYRWGLVLFNVPRKRIIQVENTYAEVRREGMVPTFPEESATGRQRVYRLPAQWQIVP